MDDEEIETACQVAEVVEELKKKAETLVAEGEEEITNKQVKPSKTLPPEVEEDELAEDEDEHEIGEDPEKETLALKLLSEFLMAFWAFFELVNKRLTTPAKDGGGKALPCLPPLYEIIVPHPLNFPSTLKKFCSSPAAFYAMGSTFVCVDPHAQFEGKIAPLKCKCGHKLERNGFLKDIRPCVGLGNKYFLKIATYVCRARCEEARKLGQSTLTFNALTEHLQQQLPPWAQETRFVNTERGSVNSWDLKLAMCLAEHGAPFGVSVKAANEAEADFVLWQELRRMNLFREKFSAFNSETFGELSVLDFQGILIATAKRMRTMYVKILEPHERLMQALLVRNASEAKVVSHDHVFPWGQRSGVNGAVGIFNVLNPFGQPIISRGVASKGIVDAKPLLAYVWEWSGKKIRFWFTDYADNDVGTIREISDVIEVLEDVFHIVKRLHDCVAKNSPYRDEWERVVTAAFFEFDGESVAEFLKKYEASDPDLRKKCENVSFLKKQAEIRRTVRQPDKIFEALDQALGYFLRKGCFGDPEEATVVVEVHQNLERQLRFCNYPSDFEWYIAVRTPKKTVYFTLRGTNAVENFNRMIQQARIHMYSVDVAHLILLRLCVRRTLDISRRILGVRLAEGAFNLDLINRFICEEQIFRKRKLVSAERMLIDEKCLLRTVDGSLCQSGLANVHGSAVERAVDLVKGGSVFDGRIRINPPSSTRLNIDELASVTSRFPPYKPFELSQASEMKYLLYTLASGRFWKVIKNSHRYVMVDDLSQTAKLSNEFWEAVAKTSPDQIVRLHKLAIHWNFSIIEMIAAKQTDVRFWSMDFAVAELRFKEAANFSDVLKRYAASVMIHNCPQHIRDAARASVTGIVRVMQSPIRTTVPSSSISEPGQNSADGTFEHGSDSSTKRSKVDTTVSSASDAVGAPAEGKKQLAIRCPLCQNYRHKKGTSCEFAMFEDNEANYLRKNASEPRRAAAIRAWAEKERRDNSVQK